MKVLYSKAAACGQALKRRAAQTINRCAAQGQVMKYSVKERLASQAGAAELVSSIILVIIVIVVAAVVIMPQVFDTAEGALENADSKIDGLWDYKG